MSINSISFKTNSLNPNAYQVSVSFLGNNNEEISKSKTLNFMQNVDPLIGTNIDSFTKNSSVSSKGGTGPILKNIFGKTLEKDLRIIAQTKKTLSASKENINGITQNIVTIDLNDSQAKYEKIDSIVKGEKVVKEFLEDSKPRSGYEEIYNSLKNDLNIDFMLSEGPIKHGLIRKGDMFSDEQLNFLLSKQGKGFHCQLAEFIMNGFKLGQLAQIDGNSSTVFDPKNYIFYIGAGDPKPFLPLTTSLVLLPPEYKDMYAGEKEATNVTAFKNLYKTEIKSHQGLDITSLIISKGI